MIARRANLTDISDSRWALIGPTLHAWQQARLDRRPTGEPARTDVREALNAIYVNRTGIAWTHHGVVLLCRFRLSNPAEHPYGSGQP
ncbi:transposase [Actinoplanes rishiriensis]|uniref:Uncharacterized protein n=1 Tax=Paractinoplanes rishiriensis TaxID=1050105 RepID=A0A919K981_9ACTN|nr:hypothetical protein Ari01nite_84490 [Actinoplanes rishiriensis]